MTDYGEDIEDTHESMHMRRRERHYSGHKLAVGVGHNKLMRAHGSESTKRKDKEAKGGL